MKTLFISVATAALLLTACSSNKTAEPQEAPAPQISLEEAMTQCRQSAGETDRAAFDACMKDKGFQRSQAPAGAAAPAAQ